MAIWQLESGYRAIERWVQACDRCGGAWVDRGTLTELVRNAAAVAEARGSSEPVPRRPIEDPVVYRGCPSCGQMMHRRNFGRISGVVVDECRACGTWFDAGELEAVLEFVRAGGLTLADAYERREAERQAARTATPRQPVLIDARGPVFGSGVASFDLEADLLVWFGRWIARWLRRPRRRDR
jgi:Zn-finger nucleic acid-binding protein